MKAQSNAGTSTMQTRLVNPSGFEGLMLLVNGAAAQREAVNATGRFVRLKLINGMGGALGHINLGFTAEARRSCSTDVLMYDAASGCASPVAKRPCCCPLAGALKWLSRARC
eukprot:1776513-Prymnesium_polylepis.1